MSYNDLKDKVVIVTGAGSGIGAAVAVQFASEGARVALAGRSADRLAATAQRCAAAGRPALALAADISREDDARRIVQATLDEFGQLDVLVNNAAISREGSICEGDVLKAYDEVMNTNLRAAIHLTTLAAPHLIKTKGNVINISSIGASAVICIPNSYPNTLFAYSISKAALCYFTKCAAAELAPHGVRVNTISPGPVRTDILSNNDVPSTWDDFKALTALNRVAEPEEIADLVLFLASEKARSITGSNYISDNGALLKR